MPLLSPNQIHRVQEHLKDQAISDPEDIKDLLKNHNLSPSEILETVGEIMRGADTSASRLSAATLGLKLNKIMADDKPTVPVVNIIINDSEFSSINPIFIPR